MAQISAPRGEEARAAVAAAAAELAAFEQAALSAGQVTRAVSAWSRASSRAGAWPDSRPGAGEDGSWHQALVIPVRC